MNAVDLYEIDDYVGDEDCVDERFEGVVVGHCDGDDGDDDGVDLVWLCFGGEGGGCRVYCVG